MNSRRLPGRVALVTGGTRGIGRSIAAAFAAEGASVIVSSRDQEACDRVAAELGGGAIGIAFDLGDVDNGGSLVDRVVEHFGRLDILVNNAGMTRPAPAVDLQLEDWQQTIDVNLTGPFFLAQAAGRQMLEQGAGVILNIASVGAYQWPVGRVAYSVAKAGLVTMTQALAGEWAPTIRVNGIAPGYVETEMVAGLVADNLLERSAMTAAIPLARLGRPDEIGSMAVALVSDDASFVTGVVVPVDGGWLVAPRRSV